MLIASLLDVSVIAGPLPTAIEAVGAVAGVGLLAGRSRAWWLREVPLAVVTGVVVAAGVGLAVGVFRPFPDLLPTRILAWVAVLAADLPFLRAAHLRALLAASAGQDGAVLTDDGGRPQWLAGCWRAAALRRAVAGYRGASLHGLLSPLHPVSVRIEPGPGEPPPWLDCDTEADLRRARQYPAR